MTRSADTTLVEDRSAAPARPSESGERSVAADSGRVAVWTLLSRLTGFARVFLIAAVLGPTHFGNLFQLANQLPWVLYELVAGSLLASLIVPALVASDRRGGDTVGLARGLTGLVVVGFGAVAVVAAALAPLLLGFLARAADGVDAARYTVDGSILVALTAPQLVGYGLVAVAVSAQNSRGRFSFAAGAPAVENLVMMATVVVYAVVHGRGLEIGAVPRSGLLLLGLGSTAAVALHAALQWLAAARVGITLRPTRRVLTPEVRSVLALGGPAAATAALNGARHLGLLAVTGTVAGGIVAYNVAIGFLNLPIALGARPVATAQLPVLSGLADATEAFRAERRRGVALAALLVVPAGLAFVGLAPVLADGVAWGELGSPYGRALTTAAVAAVGIGVWGEAVYQLGTHAAYARRRPRPPLEGMVVRVVGVALGAALALAVGAEGARLVGLVLAVTSVGDLLGALVTHRRAGTDALPVRRLAILLGLALAVIVPLSVVLARLDRPGDGPAATLVAALAGAVAVGVPLAIGAATEPQLRRSSDGKHRPPTTDANAAAVPTAERVVVAPIPNQGVARSPLHALPTIDVWAHLSARIGPRTAVVAGLAVTALIGVAGLRGLLVVAGLGILWATYQHPPVAAYAMVGLAPFLIGFERGDYLPLLRPNEALLGALVGVLVVRGVLTGERPAVRLTSLDLAMGALAVFASVVPLLVAVGRLRQVGFDDVLYAVTFWKFIVLYGLFRAVVRTPEQVRLALWILVATASVIGILAALDGRNVAGTADRLAAYFPVLEGPVDDGRGAATIGNAIGAGGYLVIALVTAVAMVVRGDRPRGLLWAAVGACVVGVLGTGQFTAVIGLAVAGLAVGWVTRSLGRLARLGVPAVLLAGLLMGPVIQERIDGFETALTSQERREIEQLPGPDQAEARRELDPGSSWDVRWYNLETYFIPAFDEPMNLAVGVTPQARARAEESYRDWVWIESGYLWLVWSGGVPLTLAFVWLIVAGAGAMHRIARARHDPIGQAAAAAFAAVAMLAVIQALDPHLTLRGTADLLYPILALAQAGSTGRALFPAAPSPAGVAT